MATIVTRVERVEEKVKVAQKSRIGHQVEIIKVSLFNRETK